MLGDAIGVVPSVRHGPDRLGDIRRSCGDPSLMIASLGVRCDTRVHDGLCLFASPDPVRHRFGGSLLTSTGRRTA